MKEILTLCLFVSIVSCVDESKYDIRQYYDKPYCEESKVGAETIKKCYNVVEVIEKKVKQTTLEDCTHLYNTCVAGECKKHFEMCKKGVKDGN